MDVPWNEQFADANQADGLGFLRLELSPHEQVIWTGQPRSVGRLVLRSVPKAIVGLALVAFVLCWMVMVIGGGHNNWDKGRVVTPLARHNVLIAALAGLWMIPPGLYKGF